MSADLNDRIQLILSKPYARKLTPDETGGYVVTVLEFPGCIGEGDTPEEALANFDAAAAAWLETSLELGRDIKEPIDFDGYSGKLALRIPRSMHRQIAEYSEIEGVSINQLIGNAIATYCGEHRQLVKFEEVVNQIHLLSSIRAGADFFNLSVRPDKTMLENTKLIGNVQAASSIANKRFAAWGL